MNLLPIDVDIDRVEQILPQTQCGQCGFGGCRPYATALVMIEKTPLNLCPPGGEIVVTELQKVLRKKEYLSPLPFTGFQTVSIDESHCIGCTLCLDVCPTDAIIGSPKHLHRIIDEDCTGCGLCIPVCPVDCISWNVVSEKNMWNQDKKEKAYHNHQAKQQRLQQLQDLSGQMGSERIPTTFFEVQKIKQLDKKNILAALKSKI